MANLRVSGVTKVYPSGKTALAGISLSSADSEFLAVVGGASSGKSTLLRVIAGLEESDEGEIFIGDKQVNGLPAKLRDVAVIFGSNTLYPTMTVAENIGYGLKLRKYPQSVIDQRVEVVSEMLGLKDVLWRKPKALTAGQKLLATYGRAIAREPKIYLFDDPLAGLDEKLRAEMRGVIVNLQARIKGTFIYATKNVAEAMCMATRIAVLKDGLLQQVDTPVNLYDYPANEYVAFLIGSPSMNFVRRAKCVKSEEGYAVAFGGVSLPLPENIVSRWSGIEEYAAEGREVTLGIRPEDIAVDKGGPISGKVSTVDTSFVDGYTDIDAGGNTFSVKLGGAAKGSGHTLAPDMSRLYVFDGNTGLTLLSRDEGYVPDGRNPDAEFSPLSRQEAEERLKALAPEKPEPKKKR